MGARDFFDVGLLHREAFNAHLRPPLRISCPDWADKFREIAKGPEKGRWRTSRTPYLREPMECTDPEHPAQRVVMQFATQLGKSEVIYNAVCKRIHVDPMDMLFVQPTLNDAKDHSRQRFTPTVKRMPEILSRLPPPRSREEQNTWQTKEIRGGATLFFAGANSARSLASKPLPFATCDEIDGYPLDVDGEGDPLGLVWERLSNFPNRKMLLCSTPTVRGFSLIEAQYLASDRRKYNVPCPHCGAMQALEWGADTEHGIKWLKTPSGDPRPDTAVYICRECAAAIEEFRHKTQMLADGRWIAGAPEAWARSLTAGFQLSKLYSPLGWKSWAMLVDDWAKAMAISRSGDQTKLKTFINTSLAETFEEQGDKADQHALRRRANAWPNPFGHLHPRCFVATMGVDVQGDRLEASIWGWGRNDERHLVDRRVFHGDPASPERDSGSPWAALTEYRRTPVLHPSGRQAPMLGCFVDSGGHHTQAVYAYCRAHQHEGVFACKGSSQSGKAVLGKPTQQDINYRGERIKRGVKLWPIGTDTAKAEIYGRLRVASPGPGFVHLSAEISDEGLEQLTAERLVTRYIKGHPKLEWVKPPGKRNEELDKAVYALAAAHYAGIPRWREAEWLKWEKRVGLPLEAQVKPAAAPTEEAVAEPVAAARPARRRSRGSIGGRR